MKKKYTILIVDDEVAILELAVKTLRNDDYELVTAKNGEEGLVKLNMVKANLIISDQKMDGMSGVDFLKKAKNLYPNLITIMLTGYAEPETAIKAKNDAGVYRFIVKPWNTIDFRITVKRALEMQHLIMEKCELEKRLEEQRAILKEVERMFPGLIQKEEEALRTYGFASDIM